MGINGTDIGHLRRCIDLARQALDEGDEPFGSILVDETGTMLFEGHNEVASGDGTAHPELAIAQWAFRNLTPARRAACTVYTSGEHCPMCAGAHGWAGLGRIVFAASGAMLDGWLREWGVAPAPVAPLPVGVVVPGVAVDGPADELVDLVRELHRRSHGLPGGTPGSPEGNA
ncbi:nucleoside deaminase [Paeniglutamicibacter sp. R2-26]|uniref:nucleoside deaminase n=1 Tax=Paeniglutamicibacter sp. R2-26 TaxID=3144417 RepID=UPI003EE800D6